MSIFNDNSRFDARESIKWTKAENNAESSGQRYVNLSGHVILGATYNWRKHVFYFMKPELQYSERTGWWQFGRVDLNEAGSGGTLGRALLEDTGNHASAAGAMVSNKIADIVYCFILQGHTTRLYEVSRNGIFAMREISLVDSADNPWTAEVDETSGNIFLVGGRTLKKINPATGEITAVATYSSATPGMLCYNENDKMFYAVDHPGAYRLLRINPVDGTLSVQGTIDKVDTMDSYYEFTFDRCSNQYIFVQRPNSFFHMNAYWVNLENAKVSKTLSHVWSGIFPIYVNGKIPQ